MKKNSALLTAALAIGMASAVPALPAQGSRSPAGNPPHTVNDADRDGTCDICGNPVGSGRINAQGQRAANGKHYGPGDSTGNQGNGPKDGTGYGAQSGKRSGPRDGSGIGRQQAGGSPGRGARRGGRSR